MREFDVSMEPWKMVAPFQITGHTFTRAEILYVRLAERGAKGHGEGAGVYYLGESGDSMRGQAESVRAAIEAGASRAELLRLLPAGGARNAIDCALWDLEAKLSGRRAWDLAGVETRETITFNTVGIDSPAAMADTARTIDGPRIKIKLDADRPVQRVAAVREARPDALIIVDVNQGWSFEELVEYAPRLKELGVEMIEQPLPRGDDAALEGYTPPLPLCADESCLHTGEFEQAARRYQMINIKLDKTGGLTEALELARCARQRGLGLMVGNMLGTSLAMAPGYVVAQLCRFTDLDGALFLQHDREHPMSYRHGVVSAPERALWG